jgi:hypothetical protein
MTTVPARGLATIPRRGSARQGPGAEATSSVRPSATTVCGSVLHRRSGCTSVLREPAFTSPEKLAALRTGQGFPRRARLTKRRIAHPEPSSNTCLSVRSAPPRRRPHQVASKHPAIQVNTVGSPTRPVDPPALASASPSPPRAMPSPLPRAGATVRSTTVPVAPSSRESTPERVASRRPGISCVARASARSAANIVGSP